MGNETLNRRTCLKLLAAAAGAFSGGCRTFGEPHSKLHLACQMWSVNKLWRKDFSGTLHKMRAMGYEGVQSMAFWKWDRTELHKVLTETNMVIADMPVDLGHLAPENMSKTLEFCDAFGVDFLFVPWFTAKSRAEWEKFADTLAAAAVRFAPHGIKIGYHNHQHEIKTKFDNVGIMDILISHSSLAFELDVGHVKLAGDDPVRILKKITGRVPSIHAKPGGGDAVGGIGDRNDWNAILAACRMMGTRWAVVECETRQDTFTDIEQSARFLRPSL